MLLTQMLHGQSERDTHNTMHPSGVASPEFREQLAYARVRKVLACEIAATTRAERAEAIRLSVVEDEHEVPVFRCGTIGSRRRRFRTNDTRSKGDRNTRDASMPRCEVEREEDGLDALDWELLPEDLFCSIHNLRQRAVFANIEIRHASVVVFEMGQYAFNVSHEHPRLHRCECRHGRTQWRGRGKSELPQLLSRASCHQRLDQRAQLARVRGTQRNHSAELQKPRDTSIDAAN